MNKERVLQALDNLKGSLETMDYGKWGVLNVEQRNFMRALCTSWLILDDATNKQTEEIERLNNIIKRLEEDLREMYLTFGEFSEEYTENRIKELKGESNEKN